MEKLIVDGILSAINVGLFYNLMTKIGSLAVEVQRLAGELTHLEEVIDRLTQTEQETEVKWIRDRRHRH